MKPSLALRFWLKALDTLTKCGLFGSRIYIFALRNAARCHGFPKSTTTREKRP